MRWTWLLIGKLPIFFFEGSDHELIRILYGSVKTEFGDREIAGSVEHDFPAELVSAGVSILVERGAQLDNARVVRQDDAVMYLSRNKSVSVAVQNHQL